MQNEAEIATYRIDLALSMSSKAKAVPIPDQCFVRLNCDLPAPRINYGLAALTPLGPATVRKVLIIGGNNGRQLLSTCLEFDPQRLI